MHLDTERSHAAGPTRIPWSSIIRYAEHVKADEEQTADLVFFVTQLDVHVVDKLIAKQKKEMPRGKKPGRSR